MKRKLSQLGILLCALWSAATMAGGMEGGGGKGVFCNGTLRVLDLYEAEEIYHLTLVPAYPDLHQNLAHFGGEMDYYLSTSLNYPTDDPYWESTIAEELESRISNQFVDIPLNGHLEPTPDATLPNLPSGCSFVQIVKYADDGKIYRDYALWDLLDVRGQAALVIHEDYYHNQRKDGVKLSDQVRRVVGLAFADQLTPLFGHAREAFSNDHSSVIFCGELSAHKPFYDDKLFGLYAIDDQMSSTHGVSFYFFDFRNQLVLEKLMGFVPDLNLHDLWIGKFKGPISTSVTGELFRSNYELKLTPGERSGVIRIQVSDQGKASSDFIDQHCFQFNH